MRFENALQEGELFEVPQPAGKPKLKSLVPLFASFFFNENLHFGSAFLAALSSYRTKYGWETENVGRKKSTLHFLTSLCGNMKGPLYKGVVLWLSACDFKAAQGRSNTTRTTAQINAPEQLALESAAFYLSLSS